MILHEIGSRIELLLLIFGDDPAPMYDESVTEV